MVPTVDHLNSNIWPLQNVLEMGYVTTRVLKAKVPEHRHLKILNLQVVASGRPFGYCSC